MTQSKHRYVLCIDLGTSGCKAALFTTHGENAGFAFSPVPLHLIQGGGAEQDPADWWNAICQSTKELFQNSNIKPEEIIAVSANTQWSGTVPVDKSGQNLMNCIIWLDSRGADQINRLRKGLINISGYGASKILRWIKITGGAPGATGKDPIAHILFIKEQFPEVFNNTYKFLEPKDYVNLKLTGKFLATYDSITLHWVTDNRDLSKVDYHAGLLKMTGLKRDMLPDLAQATDVIGTLSKEAARDLGLSESVVVIGGTPDTTAAAVGSGAVRDYEGHSYLGTSSWISAHVPFKKTDIGCGVAALPSAIPNRYYIANEQETAGNALTFLKENILYHKDELLQEENVPDVYKIFDRVAATAPAGSNGLIFTPWMYGERTPVDDPLIRGGWHNVSLDNNRADLIRSCLEGVAFNQKWLLNGVEKLMKRKMETITLVGGGGISDIWCQIHADIFNRKIRQVEDPIQANARGSAFLAGIALGDITFDDIPDRIKTKRIYEPDPKNRKVYDDMFKEFINIYHANKKIHARLNRGKKH